MLFNSYPPGVLVSPKLHPLSEAARISQKNWWGPVSAGVTLVWNIF